MLAAAALLALAASAVALPVTSGSGCASSGTDPAFTTSCDKLAASVVCPNGITGAANGIVLLVHGTGSTGEESWAQGPYVQLLPKAANIDACWINLPNRSLSDAQVSAEYVAYNIRAGVRLSSLVCSNDCSSTRSGLCSTTRQYVTSYVALAGDFHGTAESVLLCAAPTVSPCAASVYQQTIGSHYLAAQNKRGNTDLLAGYGGATTSLYTIFDDIIQPEGAPGTIPTRLPPPLVNPTSNLPNSAVFALQDPTICGLAHPADHFSMLIDPAAYNMAKQAVLNRGAATAAKFSKASCTFLEDNVLATDYQAVPAYVKGIVADVIATGFTGGQPRSATEPKLMPYVCAAGDAPASQCA